MVVCQTYDHKVVGLTLGLKAIKLLLLQSFRYRIKHPNQLSLLSFWSRQIDYQAAINQVQTFVSGGTDSKPMLHCSHMVGDALCCSDELFRVIHQK